MEEDFYGNDSLAQFDATRSRLLRANEGIAANNRRVRMLGFERAMKAQYGPKVEIDPTGVATRNGKVVGNFNEYVKAGGKLQGTPRDTRSQLEIRRQENKRLRENYKEPTFEERMNTLFPKKEDNRITSETFNQPTGINLDEMSQYTDTGEEGSNDYTDLANLVSAKPEASGTNQTSTRDRLKLAQAIKDDPSTIQKGLMESGFTAERLADLKIKQQDFKSMSRKDFAEKYPKSQTAKRLKLRLKKK
tara:strand:- start:336 stop:1076 length:741 start_codon:yes stop_codon:yes gene_type:complete